MTLLVASARQLTHSRRITAEDEVVANRAWWIYREGGRLLKKS